jgi:hypothetical protein
VVGAAVAVPLVAVSIAYACTALAILALNTGQADAGQVVHGTGRGFSNATRGAASPEPVIIRFNTRNGQELWRGRPDAGGNIAFSFTVPSNATPGSFAIIATQNTADGQLVPGTPGRAELRVSGPQATANSTAVAAPERVTGVPGPQAAGQPASRSGAAAVAPAPGTAAAAPGGATAVAPGDAAATPGAPGAAPAVAPAAAADNARAAAPAGSAAAPAADQRRAMIGTASKGLTVLPLALVAAGIVLTLAATGMVLARRRDDKALAWTRR